MRYVVVAICVAWSCGSVVAEEGAADVVVVKGSPKSSVFEAEGFAGASELTLGDARTKSAHHLQDMLGFSPNTTYSGGTSRPRYFQLRGIGERSQFAGEGVPNFSVGYAVDGVHLEGIGMAGALFDLQEVVIERGPQPVKRGGRGMAGNIEVRSKEPVPYVERLLQTTVGTDALVANGVMVNQPLSEDWALRLSLYHHQQDGFRDNVFLGRKDTNGREEWTGRAKLKFDPGEKMTWLFSALWLNADNGYDAWAPDNNGLDTYSDEPGEDSQETVAVSWEGALSLSPIWGLDLAGFFQHSDMVYSYDGDWGNPDFWAGAPYFFDPVAEGYAYSFFDRTDRTRRSAGQEAVLSYQPEEGRHWRVGSELRWLDESDVNEGFVGVESDYVHWSGALFADGVYALDEVWSVEGGARFEHQWFEYEDNQGVGLDEAEPLWGTRLGVRGRLNERWSGYASFSRGFKGGGVNQDDAVPDAQRVYDPESLYDVEVGIQGSSEDGRWKGKAGLFYMRRYDVQIGTHAQLDPEDPTSFTYLVDNAAEGEHVGLEFEGQVRLLPSWRLFGNVGLLEARFSDYDTDLEEGNSLRDREAPQAPSWSYQVGTRWSPLARWFFQVEVEGKDAYYFSDSHDFTSEVYHLLHASFGYAANRWSVRFWGRNVLDEAYDVRAFYFGLEPPQFEDTLYTSQGDPAQFGITLDVHF